MTQDFNKSNLHEFKARLDPGLIQMIKKNFCACFSGHRPHKLGKYGLPKTAESRFLSGKLREAVEKAISSGYWYFISGGSMGFDSMAAELILELRRGNPGLFLEIAVPCPAQADKWTGFEREKRRSILNAADLVTIVSNTEYNKAVMQKRNKYMVDSSSLLICCDTGLPGGTRNTIEYADKNGVPVINIMEENPLDLFN